MNDLLSTIENFGISPIAIIAQIIIIGIVVLGLLRTRHYPDQPIRYLWVAMILVPIVLVTTGIFAISPWANILWLVSLSLSILSLFVNRPSRRSGLFTQKKTKQNKLRHDNSYQRRFPMTFCNDNLKPAFNARPRW